jgi:phosphate/sulfate permease
MAGLISGMGALFGAVVFWVCIGLIIAYGIDNATLEASLEQLQNLSVEGNGDITAVRAMLSMAVLFMTGVGVVSGLMSLSMSLIGGLIGAHLAKPRV